MRWVIGGVAYDTDTATFIARGDHGHELSTAWWSLYRTRRGAFFEVVAGHDGVIEEVNPLTDEQARGFLETNASYLVEKYFGRTQRCKCRDNPAYLSRGCGFSLFESGDSALIHPRLCGEVALSDARLGAEKSDIRTDVNGH